MTGARQLLCAFLVVCVFTTLLSCVTVQRARNETGTQPAVPSNEPYYTGDGCKGIRMAIVSLKASGQALSESEMWYPEFIQGILTNDFTRFSNMEIADRIFLETVLDEQKLSQSGDFSDNDYIRIGNLTNVQYILTGSLIKIASIRYRLQLAIIDTEKGTRYKSYDQECSNSEIQTGTAIKRASEDLLAQMGVNLTETGKFTLRGLSVEADTSIAQGISARKSGNTIETLNYFYNALAFDPSSVEAAKRLTVVQKEVAENEEGATLRNDIKSQALWKKTLNEYIDFYTDHLPLELVFSQHAVLQSVDYAQKTYTLQLTAGIRWTEQMKTMQNILNNINDGLKKSKKREAWGFSKWPNDKELFNKTMRFSIAVEILDDAGQRLTSASFALTGQLGINSNQIYAITEQSKAVTFPPISYIDPDEAPDNFTVRIVSINSDEAELISEQGLIRITPVSGFPAEQQLPSVVINMAKERRESEKKQKREAQAAELRIKWEAYKDNYSAIPKTVWELGYVYEPDFPLGFRIGFLGFYTTWNFYLPDWREYEPEASYVHTHHYDEKGVVQNASEKLSYKNLGSVEQKAFEWLVGFSINIIDNVLMIPIGIGARSSLEYRLYERSDYYSNWKANGVYWLSAGKPETYTNDNWETKFVFEIGLELTLIKWISVLATYRSIGTGEERKNSYTIGSCLTVPINRWW